MLSNWLEKDSEVRKERAWRNLEFGGKLLTVRQHPHECKTPKHAGKQARLETFALSQSLGETIKERCVCII